MPTILAVDDDQDILSLLKKELTLAGFVVFTAENGGQATDALQKSVPDLIILDMMLPDATGLELAKRFRKSHPGIALLMLTARTDEFDRMSGFEAGVDDYVVKPFSMRELIARCQAILRRTKPPTELDSKTLTFRNLSIDPVTREVLLHQKPVELTALEFDLLIYLARAAGRPFRREELLTDVWGYNYSGYDHTVNTHINRLRAKIEEDPQNPTYIVTVWGVGYKFGG